MMREFKIQFILEDECIGNKVFGKLTYSLDEILEGITNEYICEKACESFSPANGVEADFKIIAKRQFTGLQDKNGVEAYHKDIGIDKFNKKVIIEWNENHLCYGLLTIDDIVKDEWNFCLKDLVEIIGNIYENKELLN